MQEAGAVLGEEARGCGAREAVTGAEPHGADAQQGALSVSPGDRVGARGVPRCRRPPTAQGSSCAFPTGGRREFGRGRGQRLFPRRSSGRDRARGAIFNVFGHQSLRSLGTRACGAPGSCWDSAASGPLAPGPRGRTRAPASEEARAAPWGCLPERPLGPSRPTQGSWAPAGQRVPRPQHLLPCRPP